MHTGGMTTTIRTMKTETGTKPRRFYVRLQIGGKTRSAILTSAEVNALQAAFERSCLPRSVLEVRDGLGGASCTYRGRDLPGPAARELHRLGTRLRREAAAESASLSAPVWPEPKGLDKPSGLG